MMVAQLSVNQNNEKHFLLDNLGLGLGYKGLVFVCSLCINILPRRVVSVWPQRLSGEEGLTGHP